MEMAMRRDPSDDPARWAPLNKHGMWKCSHCEEWNDPENEACFHCDEPENRP